MAFEGRKAFAARFTLVTCALFASVAILFAHQGFVQLASAHYNSAAWDGESLVNSSVSAQDRQYGATDEYHSLARSFAEGRLDLAQEPPSWLETIENPYDPALRNHATEETGEQAKMDAAYYDGSYYVYFGALPVLLLYLPFYMATGLDFPNSIAVLIFTIAFIVGIYLTVRVVVEERYRTCSLGVFLLTEMGVLLSCGAIWLINSPNFYNVPISCGLCMAVWGLNFWTRGVLRRKYALIAFGSVFTALTAASRPTLLAICVLLPFVIYLFTKSGVHSVQVENGVTKPAAHAVKPKPLESGKMLVVKLCLAVLIPFAVVACVLMVYNAARFGSPFDFGANYNLTGNDMTRRGFEVSRFFEGAFAYLFQAPAIEPTFPFMYPAGTSSGYIGYTSREIITGGVFALFPFYWFLASVPFLGIARRRRVLIWALCLIALIICFFDMQASGITGRYCEDFCFLFALAAGFALLELIGNASAQTKLRVGVAMLLVFVTCLFVLVMLLFGLGNNWFAGYSSPTVWELARQTFQFWS